MSTAPAPASDPGGRIANLTWLLVVLIGSSVWCTTSARHLGPTFDETLYVRIGLDQWRSGSSKSHMSDGVMPLPTDVQTLPLYLSERDRGVPYDPVGDLPALLPAARAGTLVFWWALLIYAFRWGHLAGGNWGGRWASGLITTDPNFLAHAALATTDIAMTATVLIAVYHFYRGRQCGPWLRVVLPGVLYGVALSAKASALPYVPLLFAVVGMNRLFADGALPRPTIRLWATLQQYRVITRRLRWDLCYTFALGLIWVFVYTGNDGKPEPQFAEWAHSLAPGLLRDSLVWLADRGTAGFPNAWEGLARQVKHGMTGHGGTVVFGKWYPDSRWFYFPATLAVKLPDSTLVLGALILLAAKRVWRSPAAWAAAFLFLFSLTTQVQLGIRIVFPLVAFLLIVAGAVLSHGIAHPTIGRRRLAWLVGVAALAYSINESANVWPDGIRYTNRLAGGNDRGAEWLADSNYDWGQGLPELDEWRITAGKPEVFIWYFGSDPQAGLPPFQQIHVHKMGPDTEAAIRARVGNGDLAVSTTILNACPDRRPHMLRTVAWLRSLTPVARTRTMLIYRFQ